MEDSAGCRGAHRDKERNLPLRDASSLAEKPILNNHEYRHRHEWKSRTGSGCAVGTQSRRVPQAWKASGRGGLPVEGP